MEARKLDKFYISMPIVKRDEEKRTVTGWAALCKDGDGNIIIDHQNHVIPITELEKSAHALMTDGGIGKAGEMHKARIGDIVESMVVSEDKRAALGFGEGVEGWAVTMKINDVDSWDRVKNGERPELSIHGNAYQSAIGKRNGKTVYALEEITTDEISLVDHGASGNHAASPLVVLAKRFTKEVNMSKEKKEVSKGEGINVILESLGLDEKQMATVLALFEELANKPAQKQEPKPEEKKPEAPPVAPPMAKRDEEDKEKIELQKRLDEQKAEKVELEKRVKQLEDDRVMIEMEKRAEKRPYLPIEKRKQAEIMKRASELFTKEEYATLEKFMDTTNEALKKSEVFKEFGASGEGDTETAAQKVSKKAQEIVDNAMKNNQKISMAKARTMVYENDPELYKQYDSELRS